jgi:hypothetical protein
VKDERQVFGAHVHADDGSFEVVFVRYLPGDPENRFVETVPDGRVLKRRNGRHGFVAATVEEVARAFTPTA